MSGELIKRDLGALDNRRHTKEERVVLRDVQFAAEVARLRVGAAAQAVDDNGELLCFLGDRAKARMEKEKERNRVSLALHPDDLELAMDFADIDLIVKAGLKAKLLDFSRDS